MMMMMTRPQSGTKLPFLGPSFVLVLPGIRRLLQVDCSCRLRLAEGAHSIQGFGVREGQALSGRPEYHPGEKLIETFGPAWGLISL